MGATGLRSPGQVAVKTNGAAPNQHRGAMMSKVHVAVAQLGLAEDGWRDILERLTGKRSLRACSPAELDQLLAEFRRLGWRATRRPLSQQAIVRMIYGVWGELGSHLTEPGDAALRAFVRRQTKSEAHPEGIDAPEFLTVPDATKVLEGLKAWRARIQRKGQPHAGA